MDILLHEGPTDGSSACSACLPKPYSPLRPAVQGMKNFLGGMGLGMIANQLADLKLGELLDTPPPGLDEAVAIAKVRLVAAG